MGREGGKGRERERERTRLGGGGGGGEQQAWRLYSGRRIMPYYVTPVIRCGNDTAALWVP